MTSVGALPEVYQEPFRHLDSHFAGAWQENSAAARTLRKALVLQPVSALGRAFEKLMGSIHLVFIFQTSTLN